jgi:hypothetical protein
MDKPVIAATSAVGIWDPALSANTIARVAISVLWLPSDIMFRCVIFYRDRKDDL